MQTQPSNHHFFPNSVAVYCHLGISLKIASPRRLLDYSTSRRPSKTCKYLNSTKYTEILQLLGSSCYAAKLVAHVGATTYNDWLEPLAGVVWLTNSQPSACVKDAAPPTRYIRSYICAEHTVRVSFRHHRAQTRVNTTTAFFATHTIRIRHNLFLRTAGPNSNRNDTPMFFHNYICCFGRATLPPRQRSCLVAAHVAPEIASCFDKSRFS